MVSKELNKCHIIHVRPCDCSKRAFRRIFWITYFFAIVLKVKTIEGNKNLTNRSVTKTGPISSSSTKIRTRESCFFQVNAFELTSSSGGRGRGVLPLTALMSHSCISNARFAVRTQASSAFHVNACCS